MAHTAVGLNLGGPLMKARLGANLTAIRIDLVSGHFYSPRSCLVVLNRILRIQESLDSWIVTFRRRSKSSHARQEACGGQYSQIEGATARKSDSAQQRLDIACTNGLRRSAFRSHSSRTVLLQP